MNRSEAPTETVREAPTAELTAALPRASGAGADARLVLGADGRWSWEQPIRAEARTA